MPTVLPERHDEWVDFHFGRIGQTTDPWQLDWEFPDPSREAVGLFTETLARSGADLVAFTDWQLAIGLNALLFMHYVQLADRLMARAPDVDAKVAACRSFARLYADCLAVRSPPVLGHPGETRGNPLERVTYMLWDASPFTSFAGGAETRGPFLDVLEGALYLENEACVESALHGLGHIRSAGLGAAPRNAALDAIIDRFLETRSDMSPALRDYAIRAKTGAIQ